MKFKLPVNHIPQLSRIPSLPAKPFYHHSLVTAVRFIVSKTPCFGSSLTPITVRAGRWSPSISIRGMNYIDSTTAILQVMYKRMAI